MDIKKKAESQFNAVDRLLHSIPGFKGYYQRELRRDSDRLQRRFIVEKLKILKDELSIIIKDVAREKRLDLLTDYDEIMRGLEKFINEVNYADSGYSGFFDLVKIKENLLEEIYRFDTEILDLVLESIKKIKMLSADPLNKSEVRLVKNNLSKISSVFKNRKEILHDLPDGEI